MKERILFAEKQYFGLNKMSLISRLALALACFFVYYWKNNNQEVGEVYFFLGIGIIVISSILIFILHFETTLKNDCLILDGLWTSRKVKINLRSIVRAEKVRYSEYIFNRSVYNLHSKGVIRFYTGGYDAIKLTDKDGLIYMIGTQKIEELTRIIKKIIKNS